MRQQNSRWSFPERRERKETASQLFRCRGPWIDRSRPRGPPAEILRSGPRGERRVFSYGRKIRKSNIEIRNKLEIRIPVSPSFRISTFEFVSNFDIRISSLSDQTVHGSLATT